MTETVPVPVWLCLLAGGIAGWWLVAHVLVPVLRSYRERRLHNAVEQLNACLQFQMPAFKVTRRQVLIERLVSDPEVLGMLARHAEASGAPRRTLQRKVVRYAREIVPSFNAFAYFRLGNFLARRSAQLLYRLRLGFVDDEALAGIGPDSTVVFVMNHRSNMDYLIVAFLAADRTALSYAVGEWARVWPLQALIRALGAYFVRRNSGNPLYRCVLRRYVQMATEGGVVQAIYPEGGLSRDGRLGALKLGLINYVASAFDPAGKRDVVFVPVGINYDRVLEDRSLLLMRDSRAPRQSPILAVWKFARAVLHNLALMARRRWYRYGYACVNFGSPFSLRSYCNRNRVDFRFLDGEARLQATRRLGGELLEAISSAIPVLPVSLVATVFVRGGPSPLSELEIKARAFELIGQLERSHAYVHIARKDRDYALGVGLRMLLLRHIVVLRDGLYRAVPEELEILRYYANSITHFLEPRARRSS